MSPVSGAATLIRGATVWRVGRKDLLIRGERIEAIDPPAVPPDATIIEAGGKIVLPGLVEAHTHMDKTLLGLGWRPHAAGPRLIDKIENERRMRRELGLDPARQSRRQALLAVALGTTHIRTHVDVDDETGLAGVEGVMATRAALGALVDIQIAAFPQSGMLIRPGVAELMEEALKLGVDVVGGLDPCALERDPKRHLDIVFAMAERRQKPVDIHLHEAGELGGFSMELIIERTRALGMQGKVMVSHAFCLGTADRSYARSLMEALAQEKISVVTTGAPSRPVPLLAECSEAGVTLCGGSDGIRDCWSPYGDGDMLERAMLIGLRNNCRRDEEIELALAACSFHGAAALGLQHYGLAPGDLADLVLVEAETPAEAVVARPRPRMVFKRGRIVARDGAVQSDAA